MSRDVRTWEYPLWGGEISQGESTERGDIWLREVFTGEEHAKKTEMRWAERKPREERILGYM